MQTTQLANEASGHFIIRQCVMSSIHIGLSFILLYFFTLVNITQGDCETAVPPIKLYADAYATIRAASLTRFPLPHTVVVITTLLNAKFCKDRGSHLVWNVDVCSWIFNNSSLQTGTMEVPRQQHTKQEKKISYYFPVPYKYLPAIFSLQ